jgi:hypothetical protein
LATEDEMLEQFRKALAHSNKAGLAKAHVDPEFVAVSAGAKVLNEKKVVIKPKYQK